MPKPDTLFSPGKKKTGGRTKGIPNRMTRMLKDAILEAAELAGGKNGLVGYLKTQAIKHPAPFLTLLGKVLPIQLTGAGGGPLQIEQISAALARMPEKDVLYLERILTPLAAATRVAPGVAAGRRDGTPQTEH